MSGVVLYLKKLGVQNVGRFVSRLPPVLGYDVNTNLAPKVSEASILFFCVFDRIDWVVLRVADRDVNVVSGVCVLVLVLMLGFGFGFGFWFDCFLFGFLILIFDAWFLVVWFDFCLLFGFWFLGWWLVLIRFIFALFGSGLEARVSDYNT